jgi:glycosyltransferase involved in cell wall biosynthesis
VTAALVVSRSLPYDAERVHGIFQRLGTQIAALARVVERIDCLFLVADEELCTASAVREHEQRLRRLWSPAVSVQLAPVVNETVPRSRWRRLGQGIFDFHAQPLARPTSTEGALRAVSAALERRPDIVLAHRLSSMTVFMKLAQQTPEKLRGLPLFFDMDDIEHIAAVRRLMKDPAWAAQRLQLLQTPALMLAELRATHLASTTFVCSEKDRRYLARLGAGAHVHTIPNSVEFPALAAADASEPLLMFVGALGYRPNAQAADSLVRQIWPIVRAQVPGARLAIIGPGPERAASSHSPAEGVTFTGFVEDLQSWYRRARVVCCPIYHGGGTRVKIIEAAAHAKAIVATRLGAEGLNFEDGKEIILRDTPAQLADSCIRLLRDPAAAALLGRAALHKARGIYERNAVIERLANIFRAGHTDGSRHGVAA